MPIEELLSAYKVDRVFIFRGEQSYDCIKSTIDPYISKYHVGQYIVRGFGPTEDVVTDAIEKVKDFGPDIMIGVGGGKILDTAKAVRVLACQGKQVKEALADLQIEKTPVPLIVIPTTAGTGSEATQFAVIYIDQIKYSMSNQAVFPDHAIIDGAFVEGASYSTCASSAFDALSQAIESYWSVCSTKVSKNYSLRTIEIILRNIEGAGGDFDQMRMDELSEAAYYSGCAISITRTTAPHAMSYFMTSQYDVPHGHAVALMLPIFFHENIKGDADINDSRGRKYVNNTMSELFDSMNCDSAKGCYNKWIDLMKLVGLETDLTKLGISTEDDIKSIARAVDQERLNNHPVKLPGKTIIQLLKNRVSM